MTTRGILNIKPEIISHFGSIFSYKSNFYFGYGYAIYSTYVDTRMYANKPFIELLIFHGNNIISKRVIAEKDL